MVALRIAEHACRPTTFPYTQDMRAGTIGQQLNTLRSGLGWHDCSCGTILRPKHTEEVADIVMALYRDQQVTGQKYLVRASSQGFMSHNNFSCACASVASDTRAVMLDMSAMNKVLEFNDDRETVTVQAGITFEVRPGSSLSPRDAQPPGDQHAAVPPIWAQ
mgnify:CR=1 FL=1